jgi:hypothetical protein
MNRNCVACGQVDDHPRHVVVLADGSDAPYHHDCHSRLNPPCAICQVIAQSAQGVTGDALREHIVNNDPGGKWLAGQQQAQEPAQAQQAPAAAQGGGQ